MSDPVVDAINDLTRVILALQGNFTSKAEVIRRLDELSVPPNRIAAILAMDAKDVRSSLAKARKKMKGQQAGREVGPDDTSGGANGEE